MCSRIRAGACASPRSSRRSSPSKRWRKGACSSHPTSAATASSFATARPGSCFRPATRLRLRARSNPFSTGATSGRECRRRRDVMSRPSARGPAALRATLTSTPRCAPSRRASACPLRWKGHSAMGGIYGILQLDGASVAADLLRPMAQVTIHRGPDDEGIHADGPLAFGMRRLSIIDLAGGHPPLPNKEGPLWLVANGEIYNYRELRGTLVASGHRFRTGSDCETILHLYEQYGDEVVGHLNGMFAFALWDTRRRRLLVGRDRLGIKPVYLWNDGRRLV